MLVFRRRLVAFGALLMSAAGCERSITAAMRTAVVDPKPSFGNRWSGHSILEQSISSNEDMHHERAEQ
jgi:hypothetical protein